MRSKTKNKNKTPKAMERVMCNEHDVPCYLKTGTKEGPSKHRSFYVCTEAAVGCKFFQKAEKIKSVSKCPRHDWQVVELQSLSENGEKIHYRCGVGRSNGRAWCGVSELPTTTTTKFKRQQSSGVKIGLSHGEKATPDAAAAVAATTTLGGTLENSTRRKFSGKPVDDNHGLLSSRRCNLDNNIETSDLDPRNIGTSGSSSDKEQFPPSTISPVVSRRLVSSSSLKSVDEFVISASAVIVGEPVTAARKSPAAAVAEKMKVTAAVVAANDREIAFGNGGGRKNVERAAPSSAKLPREICAKRPNADWLKKVVETTQPEKSEAHDDTICIDDDEDDDVVVLKQSDKERSSPSLRTGTFSSGLSDGDRHIFGKNALSSEANDTTATRIESLSKPSTILGQTQKQQQQQHYQHHQQQQQHLPQQQQQQQQKTKNGISPTWRQPTLFEFSQVKSRNETKSSSSENDSRMLEFLPGSESSPLSEDVLERMFSSQGQAMTLYGGKMTKNRTQQVVAVTEDALNQLQTRLEKMPDAHVRLTDPQGLRVPLMEHQRQALAWLSWREAQNPPGGILADDMGLGKTLTMISLFLKKREQLRAEEERKSAVDDGDDDRGSGENASGHDDTNNSSESSSGDFIPSRGTLVVCPASLVHQWAKEVERRCSSKLKLKTLVYHGPNRENRPKKIAQYDFVFTTYSIMSSEGKLPGDGEKRQWHEAKREESAAVDVADAADVFADSPLFLIGWNRVILDEAHSIKNHKAQSSISACRLRAQCRWALTGTPIQNKLLDMYSLLRFLRVSPFDEFKLWKAQVEKAKYGKERLNVLIRTLLLRRTKAEAGVDGKPIVDLPEKTVETHLIDLGEDERRVYDKVFAHCKTVLVSFLERHESRGGVGGGGRPSSMGDAGPAAAATPPGRPTQALVLVLLLRLRQSCSHLSLLRKSLESKEDKEAAVEEGIEMDLDEMMKALSVNDAFVGPEVAAPSKDRTDTAPAAAAPFRIYGEEKNRDKFEPESSGSKLEKLKERLRRIVASRERTVIVSQWVSMLSIVAIHLKKMKLSHFEIKGDTNAKRRSEIVEEFNSSSSSSSILLLSLRAGGVGLNLVGANHLFVLDMHWNPALEAQAVDRIYRMGQKKPVFIHKFICQNTIEERIKELQERKLALAGNILEGKDAKDGGGGVGANSKLTLQDLKLLFGIG